MANLKTISKAALMSIIIASCNKNSLISPNTGLPPEIPLESPIKIDYSIRILSTDTSKTTNLVNGLGYVHKVNGNWIQVVKFSSPSALIPVVAGDFFRGQFFIPTGLDNINFQSSAFLLSSVMGDPANNPNNKATIEVWANNVKIIDKRPNGFDSTSWNPSKWDIGALAPVSY